MFSSLPKTGSSDCLIKWQNRQWDKEAGKISFHKNKNAEMKTFPTWKYSFDNFFQFENSNQETCQNRWVYSCKNGSLVECYAQLLIPKLIEDKKVESPGAEGCLWRNKVGLETLQCLLFCSATPLLSFHPLVIEMELGLGADAFITFFLSLFLLIVIIIPFEVAARMPKLNKCKGGGKSRSNGKWNNKKARQNFEIGF